MFYFLAKRDDDDGTQCSHAWFGDDYAQALLNVDSGHIHGILHGAERDYSVTVFVSLLRALYLKRVTAARIVSLMPFPRCAVRLPDQTSVELAKLMIEQGTHIFVND